LRNTLERAVIVCEGGLVETKHLPPGFGQSVRPAVHDPDAVHLGVGRLWKSGKAAYPEDAPGDHKQQDSRRRDSGISLKTLHNKLKEYGRVTDAVLAAEE